MPNTNDPNSLARASSTNFLNDAPGGDIPFDQLFGTEPEASFSSANPTDQTTTQTTVAEPTQTTDTFKEVRTSTGSVYKEYDTLVRGIEEKDTLIQQLRDQVKQATGQDPLRRQEPVQAQQPQNYLSNPTRFADDLANAAKAGDAAKYQGTLLGLMEEYFGPAKPLIQEFARSRATEQTNSEYKDFGQFRRSEDFGKVLERNPALAQAIQASEQNIQFSHQLPELYRLAYESHTARRVPEIVQAARQTTAAPVQNTRPTVQQTSLTPGNAVTQQSDQDALRTTEGRKEILARLRAAGIENLTF